MPPRKRKAEEAFRPQVNGIEEDSRSRDGVSPTAITRRAPAAINGARPGLREKAQQLLRTREQLPIWPYADEVRRKVRESDVLLLVGETGSGKSTQIPQFLYSEHWCRVHHNGGLPKSKSKPIGGRIAILQPRRVAAISLASRVAAEIGTPLGKSSPASHVGYSVRFDNNVGPSTRIKFLTDGMLLQELLRGPWLKEYSCVIVDEVHERGLNVDLVMGFLRRILDALKSGQDKRDGVPLKVVVMSATADMEGIEKFFADTVAAKADRTPDGPDDPPDDGWAGFSDGNDAEVPEAPRQANDLAQDQNITVSSCYIKGRQYPVSMSYAPQAVANLLDTAMDKIIHIHQHTPLPGDILVFLSGQEMIENLESLCHTYAATLAEQDKQQALLPKRQQKQKLPGFQVLPLFASLPNHLQSRIFQPTPHFTRRVILSTNIAETSLTVPNIRHVIDTGKHKARLFRPGLNLDTLLSSAISQSMAKQRAGRAGREAPGTCYRLYTEKDYWNLEADTTPEILSTDLSFLVLTLKAHNVPDVLEFPLLTRPPRRSLEAALEGLLNLGALDAETGEIIEVGRKMAMLPVRPDLARCLLEGSKYADEILSGVVDVVAAMSLEEGIFLPVHAGAGKRVQSSKRKTTEELMLGNEKKRKHMNGALNGVNGAPDDNEDVLDSDDEAGNPIETARRQLLSRDSDHLTSLNAIIAYSSPSIHDRRTWCDRHGVSHRAMSRIMDVRKQLKQMMSNPRHRLAVSSNVASDTTIEGSAMLNDILKKDTILKCLVAGLWPNVAILSSLAPSQAGQIKQNPNQRAPYTTLLTNQPIHIHPSSVLFTHRGISGGSKSDGDKSGSRRREVTTTMPNAITFTDLIYTSKPYARNVSAIELGWVAGLGKMS